MRSHEGATAYERRQDDLRHQMSEAIHHAVPEEVFMSILRRTTDDNVLKYSENKGKGADLQVEELPYVVTCHSLAEFGGCLRQLRMGEDRVREILAHENAHANKAETLDRKSVV